MKKRKAQNNSAEIKTYQPEINIKKKEKKNIQPPVVKVIDKDLKKEHQKIQKQFQQLEEKIALLNQQKTKLETALASHDIYSDKNKFVQTETDYKTVSLNLQKANTEYETVFEKLMELENKIE